MKSKIGLISLGCAKNQVDAEVMLARLASDGYPVTTDAGNSDIVLINTCGFIESAKMEAIEEIVEMGRLKTEGKIKGIIVTGCLSQRYSDGIEDELPEVDAFLGTGSYDKILEAVKAVENKQRYEDFSDINDAALGGVRMITTLPFMSYLKIAEGCDNRCTYCVIPSIRGHFRSRTMEELVTEAKQLASRGVKELNVIAQDITRYGEDLYGEKKLPELLNQLCEIEGLKWIRLLYCYPDKITDELIDVIARQDKIVKYIDIPIQHSEDRILKAMNRRGDKALILSVLDKLRKRIPGITLRTSIIVGFPGETEAEFEALCRFVKDVKFDRLGVFAYSREEDTPAYSMEGQIDEDVKEKRQQVLMDIQSGIAEKHNEAKVGSTIEVLVEGFDKYAECWFGRSAYDAPDIDGKIFFTAKHKPTPGSFISVKIDEVMDYDLIGTAVL